MAAMSTAASRPGGCFTPTRIIGANSIDLGGQPGGVGFLGQGALMRALGPDHGGMGMVAGGVLISARGTLLGRHSVGAPRR
ncbi:hypothetical protein [Methylobacterium radiotolerans]|uniref:hypothetical protein n=1 Tax=Methylobacterium radiotolerans TaxID=31998 RepID=UPI001057B442|nr:MULTISPECIES: hypothetical protein [Methylobacterium]MDE3747804.1 hypothetical protein [Methylobacterium radiotolerans]